MLFRCWDATKPKVMFIGLNPSTANGETDDRTISRVRKIARFNGYGGIYMLNCFPFITAYPEQLEINYDQIEINEKWLLKIAKECKEVVFAYGDFKIIKDEARDARLQKLFPNARDLIINKNGTPRHPLYVPEKTKFIDFNNSKKTKR